MATTMKAWVFKTPGQPSDVLTLEPAWPVPVPSAGEVLVKVKAAALNPVGWKVMSVWPMTLGQKKPSTPEYDVAGTVAGGALEGTGFALGDEVFGQVPADKVMKTGLGTLAEYTLVDLTLLVKRPANVSVAEAAAFPLVGVTSYDALAAGGITKEGGKGKRVFINGGSSSTGIYAIQIAKHYGAEVVTTCSPSSRKLVESLKPDSALNYHDNLIQHLTETYRDKPFDLIYDTVGVGAIYHASPAFLKPEGKYIDIAGSASMKGAKDIGWVILGMLNKLVRPTWLGGTPRKYEFHSASFTDVHWILEEAAELLGNGTYRSIIDSEFKFEDVKKAYERQMSSRAKGKVIVLVD